MYKKHSHLVCSKLIHGQPKDLTRGKILKVFPVFGPEYKIYIEIKITSWGGGWPNIFHFSAHDRTGSGCCEIGQRIPSLFQDSRAPGRLYLSTNIGNNGDTTFHSVLGRFELEKWIKLSISQKKDEVFL